jgi:AraC-like DNA-binding protein
MYVNNTSVKAIRTGSAVLVRRRKSAPWGTRYPERNTMSFHMVIEGPAVWITSRNNLLTRVDQGDLVVFPPQGSIHDFMHAPKTRVRTLEEEWLVMADSKISRALQSPISTQLCGNRDLDGQLYTPNVGVLPRLLHIPASRIRANASLMSTFHLMNEELEQPQPESEKLVAHLLDLVFIYAIREWLGESASNKMEWVAAQRNRSLEKALALIHAEPSSPWTLKDLSRQAGLSRAAFSRRFSRELGESPSAYLKSYRMRLAANALLTSDTSVKEIAQTIGYESGFAFSSAFKRMNGMSPSEFRRSRQEIFARPRRRAQQYPLSSRCAD